MESSAIKEAIKRGAAEINRLSDRVHETFRYRDLSPQQHDAWSRACSEFHSRFSDLAFPDGYKDAINRIKAGDAFSIEAAICFLELRPYFFRSGYMFSKLLPKVRRAQLNYDQAKRLEAVVVRQAYWRAKRRGEHET